jgi:hypothetical protein
MKSRPHREKSCPCGGCLLWDALVGAAPPMRCAETHVARTQEPCQHGFTWCCPSFSVFPHPGGAA